VSEDVGRELFLLAVLLMAMGSLAGGLAGVIRDLGVGLLWLVGTLGVLAGWVMAMWRAPGWLAGVLTSLLGIMVVLVRVGRLGGELAAVFGALLLTYRDAWLWLLGGLLADWTPILLMLAELGADVGALLVRWSDWLLSVLAGDPIYDPVAVALVWSMAMWAVGVWAGWKVRRHQPLLGLVPAHVLLAGTLYYVWAEPFSLLPLLGATLLLMALVRHSEREHRWRAVRIRFARDIWRNLTMTAALLSLGLMVAALLAPSISAKTIVEWAQRLTGERTEGIDLVAESLGVEQRAGRGAASEPAQMTTLNRMHHGGLPRRHLLGAGPELSEQVVMLVSVGAGESGVDEPPPRYYWRSLVYDRYSYRGWLTGGTRTVAYGAGQQAISPTLASHRLVRQEVQVVGDLGDLLHATGMLVTADEDYSVAWRSPGDAFGATIAADIYRVDSLVPVVSEEQLRSAGSNYPERVQNRYLALPDTIPVRVLSLARDLTATEPTPYDRVLAIETYLRAFPYTLDVSLPPYGRDVVDYFLFDLQAGYCDYYATSMVVLARAAGVPARPVIGYNSGDYDASSERYVVAEDNAHAWVEVYFPGYGWVEFEPTASLPLIERPAEAPAPEEPELGDPLEPATTREYRSGRVWWPWLLGGLALMATVGVAWAVIDGWRLRYLEPARVVAILYGRLQRQGRRLAAPVQAGDTPYEFATSLVEWMARWAQERHWAGALPFVAQDVGQLTDLYVRASYSPRSPDDSDRARAVRAWRNLRWRLWLAWAWRLMGPLRRF